METISVFKFDPNSLTLYDEEHSTEEDRWITLGLSDKGNLLVIVHTYQQSDNSEKFRIISARKADIKEEKQYYNLKGE